MALVSGMWWGRSVEGRGVRVATRTADLKARQSLACLSCRVRRQGQVLTCFVYAFLSGWKASTCARKFSST